MTESTYQIHPEIQMGVVSLSTANLERSSAYYQNNIGLSVIERSHQGAILGAGRTPLLHLVHQPGVKQVRRVTGLYHFALLLPSRLELAETLQHLVETHTPITGASDHLVSEALYLNDPDGHGIEIYRDRPRADWYNGSGILKMDTVALDIEGVLGELSNTTKSWTGIAPKTRMGHVHLHVSHLDAARDFYVTILGFQQPPISVSIPSANFVSAGGYHHHLGLNTWAGVGAPPPPEDAARLLSYEIIFPDADSLNTTVNRLVENNIHPTQSKNGWRVQDPSQNTVILKTNGA